MRFTRRFIVGSFLLCCATAAYSQEAQSAADAVAVLQNRKASTFNKAKACQRLALVGGDDAVPALAALLADESLNTYARSALEAIGSPAVDVALREATGKLSGKPLAGVLLSLGNRRDAEAIPLLQKYLTGDEEEVAKAAAAALADVGSPDALRALADVLKSRSTEKQFEPWLAEAFLTAAEGAAQEDPRGAAITYEILILGPTPEHVKLAAKLGKFRLNRNGQAIWIIEQLQKDGQDEFNLGLAATREATANGVTAALVEQLPKYEPERRALVLRALGDRSEALPVEVLLEQAKSDSPAVLLAAVELLAESEEPAAAKELVNLALGEGEIAKAATEELAAIESDAVDQAIGERLNEPGPAQSRLVALAGARRMTGLKPQLISLLEESPEETIRCVVLTSLGQIGELDDLDLLLERSFGDASEAELVAGRNALRSAALRMSDREACAEVLVARLGDLTPEQKSFVLTRLRELGGKKALAAVVMHAKSDDPELKDAATRELGAWPTADAAEALLEIAKNDEESKYQIRALRGYLRIARQLQLSDEERLRFFHAAMETGQRDEEKRLALDVLTRIPSPKTLELTTAHLDDEALREKAAEAAVAIGGKLAASDPAAVKAAMEKVIAAEVPEDLKSRARDVQRKASGT